MRRSRCACRRVVVSISLRLSPSFCLEHGALFGFVSLRALMVVRFESDGGRDEALRPHLSRVDLVVRQILGRVSDARQRLAGEAGGAGGWLRNHAQQTLAHAAEETLRATLTSAFQRI